MDDWSVGHFWRLSDLVLRGIFIVLALMLAYTVHFVIRFSGRYYLARKIRDLKADSPDVRRVGSKLIADFSAGIGMLRGIASAAPFLGLAGTCYGITRGLFFGDVVTGSRALFEAWISSRIAAALVTTVAGVLVAIPAALSYNLATAWIEASSTPAAPRKLPNAAEFGPFHFAQTLHLKERFSGMPHFAVAAALAIACVVAILMAFETYVTPTGLPVAVPPSRCDDGRRLPSRLIVLRISDNSELFLNFEPLSWQDASRRLADIYRSRENRGIYVYADDGVPFQTVADAIDIVRSVPAPGQDSLDIKVTLLTPNGSRECAPIPIRTIPARQVFR